jgi:hypothetical protein
MTRAFNDNANAWLAGILAIGISLFWGGLIVLALIPIHRQPSRLTEWHILLSFLITASASFFGLLLGIYLLIQARRWKRINSQRQTAARHMPAEIPIVRVPPILSEEELSLPITIRLRVNPVKHLALFCLVTGAAFFFNAAPELLAGTGYFPLVLWQSSFPIAFICVIIFSVRLLIPQQITVTREGLIVRFASLDTMGFRWLWGKQAMRWEDICLFAIRGSGKLGTSATRYEISSSTDVVVWGRVYKHQWWALYRPEVSFEEYDQQMDILLALIATETTLPLYDVR